MKIVVSIQDLIEVEIKPSELLVEFAAMTSLDIADRLIAHPLYTTSCPACDSSESDLAFEKCGLIYRQCRVCASLYVSPRSDEITLIDYYRNAPSAKLWREKILLFTETTRLEKVIQPRVEWVMDSMAEYAPLAQYGIDISSHGNLFTQTLVESTNGKIRLTAAHPLADVDYPTPIKGITIAPRFLAEISSLPSADFITAFDVFDRCADVKKLVGAAYDNLCVGGLLFLTAPSSSGFDLQVLWDQAPLITPPDKINLISIEGFSKLFDKARWEICELSTPGLFDVETVRHAIQSDSNKDWHRFFRYLVMHRADDSLIALQEFLQANRLSSFARLLIRKVA